VRHPWRPPQDGGPDQAFGERNCEHPIATLSQCRIFYERPSADVYGSDQDEIRQGQQVDQEQAEAEQAAEFLIESACGDVTARRE
jgi:hypothetical protein